MIFFSSGWATGCAPADCCLAFGVKTLFRRPTLISWIRYDLGVLSTRGYAAEDNCTYVVWCRISRSSRGLVAMDETRPTSGAPAHGLVPLFPPGLQAIYGECRRLYPEQANPLQVTAIVKYWYVPPLCFYSRASPLVEVVNSWRKFV